MKPYRFEDIFPNETIQPGHAEELSEAQAETLLELLLADPENAFLTAIPKNKQMLDDAVTSNEALRIAEKRIRERLTATLNASEVHGGHSEHITVNPDAVLNALEHIRRHEQEIGFGADGRVVIDLTDTVNTHPEICYKFSLLEKVKRGRNSVSEEAELQSAFFEASLNLQNKDIAVPMPYYEIEVFTTQMIAMERLHAKSADEILTGKATLPGWFDIDRFCDSLTQFIDAMHAQNLYHRDLHFGNIMISQRPEWREGEPLGYVIDFGLSAYAFENMEPYKKEMADMTFTYDDDYGKIKLLRKSLKALQLRMKGTQV